MISIILPIYNAEGFIGESLPLLVSFLKERLPSTELVLVNDGSTDCTLLKIQTVDFRGLAVRLFSLSSNQGKFAAIKRGMNEASGDCLVFMDCDIPYQLDVLPYLEHLICGRGFHMAIGDRTLAGSEYWEGVSALRQTATVICRALVRLIITGGLFDTQCGLKAFRRDVAQALFPLLREPRFGGDIELLYIALKYNLEVRRVPVKLRWNAPSSVDVLKSGMRMLAHMVQLRRAWRTGKYSSSALSAIADQTYWVSEPQADETKPEPLVLA